MDLYKRRTRTYRKKKCGTNEMDDIQGNMYAFHKYLKVCKNKTDKEIIELFNDINIKQQIIGDNSYYHKVEILTTVILALDDSKELKKLYNEFQAFINEQLNKLKRSQPGYLIYLLLYTSTYQNYFVENILMDNYSMNTKEPYKKDTDKYFKYKDYLGAIENAYVENNRRILDSFTYNS